MSKRAGRVDLAEREQGEIEIIERFLPQQLSAQEIEDEVDKVIAQIAADSVKDMGRLMAELRERYAGRMDFGKASAIAKARLIS